MIRAGMTMAAALLLGQALADEGKPLHLFILSGQSNMAGLDPNVSFTPAVKQALAKAEVVVIKDAAGGQPIRRWYKAWKPASGPAPANNGDLYDRLLQKVRAAIGERKPATVTFVWMQGEADAKDHGDVYEASLKGLIEQLRKDLARPDTNFVIGRLSDFDGGRPGWAKIRAAQVKVAEADPRGAWVNTDDLNDKNGKNDLHYTKDGYKLLGERFAAQAIALIGKGK